MLEALLLEKHKEQPEVNVVVVGMGREELLLERVELFQILHARRCLVAQLDRLNVFDLHLLPRETPQPCNVLLGVLVLALDANTPGLAGHAKSVQRQLPRPAHNARPLLDTVYVVAVDKYAREFEAAALGSERWRRRRAALVASVQKSADVLLGPVDYAQNGAVECVRRANVVGELFGEVSAEIFVQTSDEDLGWRFQRVV